MPRLLVTGAARLLGVPVTHAAVARGHAVTAAASPCPRAPRLAAVSHRLEYMQRTLRAFLEHPRHW